MTPLEKKNMLHVAVLDREGEVLFYLYGQPHNEVSYALLPQHVIDAFLAAEDHTFFKHRGISYKGIIRSIIVNLLKGSFAQGASTITQQVVKLSTGNNSKNIIRKIREQFIALTVESHYSKEQILESYLNIAYFGSGIFGIENAANTFWNISSSDLSVEQAATLAAIVQRPEYYSPLKNPQFCVQRRNLILNKMAQEKFITLEQAEYSKKMPLLVEKKYISSAYEYLKPTIQTFFEKHIDKKYKNHSYFIYTTIDRSIQNNLIYHCNKTLLSLKNYSKEIEGGGVVIDNKTAEILAFLPGFHPQKSSFNRAFNSFRQIGSLIKPLIMYNAFSHGQKPTDVYCDEPLSINTWNPQNFTKLFEGQVTLAHALIKSNNIIPIKLVMKYGANELCNLIIKSNLTAKPKPYLSLALGCINSSPIHVAGYFRMFAGNGIYKEPYFIEKIIDENNLYYYKINQKTYPCLDALPAQLTRTILEEAAQETQKKIHFKLSFPVIAKTGTTNDIRNCWFAAASAKYTTAFYMGYDDNKSMLHIPIRSSLTVAKLSFSILNSIGEHGNFIYDPRLVKQYIDRITGSKITDNNNKDILSLYLLRD